LAHTNNTTRKEIMKEAISTSPQFFDGTIYPRPGCGQSQDYLILAMSKNQAQAWLVEEARALGGKAGDVWGRATGPTINSLKLQPRHSTPQMVNVCTFGYQEPPKTALNLYQAILDGSESISGIAEQFCDKTVINLFYLLGAAIKNDETQTGNHWIDLDDTDPDDLAIITMLADIKDACPDLRSIVDQSLILCRPVKF